MKNIFTKIQGAARKLYVTVAMFLVSAQMESYAQSSGNQTISNLEKGLSLGFKSIASIIALVSLSILGLKFFKLNNDQRGGEEGSELTSKFIKIVVGCAILFGGPDLVIWLKNLSQGN